MKDLAVDSKLKFCVHFFASYCKMLQMLKIEVAILFSSSLPFGETQHISLQPRNTYFRDQLVMKKMMITGKAALTRAEVFLMMTRKMQLQNSLLLQVGRV